MLRYAAFMNFRTTALLGVATFLVSLSGSAAGTAPSRVEDLTARLHSRFPQLKIEDVRPASFMGLYEVFTGSQLVYSDASGDHLFVGKLIDTKTQVDLAAERLETRLSIDFDQLPFDRAIKIVKGNGTHRLALFEDPDCPYCRKLEQELAGVNDATLYVFLFPLAELHPGAREHALSIWCAPDRASAWTHWMLERQEPSAATCPADPIDQLQALGTNLNVVGTPTIFLESGRRLQGVVPATKLQTLLETRPEPVS
jgi:thiol:disulfide interchange protein DsbC